MVKEVAHVWQRNYWASEVFHIGLRADSIVIEECNVPCVSLSPSRSVWQDASLTLTPNACHLWELLYTYRKLWLLSAPGLLFIKRMLPSCSQGIIYFSKID